MGSYHPILQARAAAPSKLRRGGNNPHPWGASTPHPRLTSWPFFVGAKDLPFNAQRDMACSSGRSALWIKILTGSSHCRWLFWSITVLGNRLDTLRFPRASSTTGNPLFSSKVAGKCNLLWILGQDKSVKSTCILWCSCERFGCCAVAASLLDKFYFRLGCDRVRIVW
jgi:hypothetical protein